MRLANKVFLAIFLSELCLCFILNAYFYFELKKSYEEDFQTRYKVISHGVVNTISQFERIILSLMQSATFHVEDKLTSDKMISNEELISISQKFSISGMGLANSSGKFVRSTSPRFLDPKNSITLQSLCPDYMNLFQNNAKPHSTPIVASKITGKTYKFLVSSIANGKYALNVAVKTQFLNQSFTEILKSSPEINGIALYTASNHVMTEIRKASFQGDIAKSHGYNRVFSKKIPVENGRDCCECREKHFMDDNGDYYYQLRINVSSTSLQSKEKFAALITIALFLILSFVSFIFSGHVSRRLVAGIERINSGLKELMHSGDLTFRFRNAGSIEVRQLESNLNKLIQSLKTYEDEKLFLERERSTLEVNQQIAHDIRSPVAALNILAKTGNLQTEDTQAILKAVTQRIRLIADRLVHRTDEMKKYHAQIQNRGHLVAVHLEEVITSVVEEKLIQLRGSEIQLDFISPISANAFSRVDGLELYRILANVINNAMEAMEGSGQIHVQLTPGDNNNVITIKDNGRGIKKEHLAHIFERKATFEKVGGTGLGLFHAKQMIEYWRGSISVISEEKKGTEVRLEIPSCPTPVWFVEKLSLKGYNQIILIDDDPLQYQFWQNRLEKFQGNFCWYSNFEKFNLDKDRIISPSKKNLYFIDYEFENSFSKGTEIILKVKQFEDTILISSRFNDPVLIQFCEESKVRYLFKGRIDKVEIDI